MRQFQQTRSYRRQTVPRPGRSKRPLVVVVQRDDQLQTLYSSTPQVQFVQLDLSSLPASEGRTNASGSSPWPARPITAEPLTALSLDLRHEVQRAFRQLAIF